ncbi:response regulator [Cohnella hashimotonis]|uniref:Response regulator n=1 Tax=Cohnella hashimotonis TaxID=2826895 RepID=A0ABT6TKV1_9BACL|nr:response regulator [Cohnella hashimotonis]MDI4647473.1 response regulator [Cohnella hashimotonis]
MLKAIIADDEPAILKGLRGIVQWEDYGIEIAGQACNGIEALELIEREQAAILITDIQMPEMSGLSLIKEAKRRGYPIRSIILSGYGDFGYVKEAIQLGIENYLLKPIVRDELCSTLMNLVEKINRELDRQNQLRSDSLILRNNILNRWLTNHISPAHLIERSDLLQIDLNAGQYLVCLFKILYERHHDISHRELISFASENICNEVLNRYGKVITFCDMNNHIVALFDDTTDLGPEPIRALLAECAATINKLLKCDVFITVGNRERSCDEVHNSYALAVELMNYSLLMPPNSIVDHEQIAKESFVNNERIHLDDERFQQALAEKNQDEAWRYIDDVFGRIVHSGEAPLLRAYPLVMDMLYRILNALRQIKVDAGTLFDIQDTVFIHLMRAKSLEELQSWLKTIVAKAIDKMNAADENWNPMIKRVLVYLDAHYAENVSLKTLSLAFNVNAAYLGQLFIKEKSETFSSYLNTMRIEKAIGLLTETNLELHEIAEKVGYANQSYFNIIFKKLTGLYPSKYRLDARHAAPRES